VTIDENMYAAGSWGKAPSPTPLLVGDGRRFFRRFR
jgi:hypothetical protein